MNVLTDEEIIFIENSTASRSYNDHARAIEAAVMKKLESELKDAEIGRLKHAANIGKSKDIRALAEILLSDCGCSTEHRALLDKVENRLWTFFGEQLAASQYREHQLREALVYERDFQNEIGNCVSSFAGEALLLQQDTSAIEALIARAGEVAIQMAIKVIEDHRIPVGNSAAGEMACEWTYEALKEIRQAIRALLGVTLEDLKA